MKSSFFAMAAFILFLSGCNPEVDDALVSATPATAQQFSTAKLAAKACAESVPDLFEAEFALKRVGFTFTEDERLKSIQSALKATIMEAPEKGVVVLLGSRGGENACFVGLKGMTAQQSIELAIPWVKKYGALTNAEKGQGLAKNAAQAWSSFNERRNVYIAAYKTWDILDEPGAAARLLYLKR